MSLTTVKQSDIIFKQYKYKLNAFSSMFFTVLLVQMVGLFLSLNSVGMMGQGTGRVYLNVSYYSADLVIVFTMISSFITSVMLTTKSNRNADFSFITNRATTHYSNALFIVTMSLISGITAILSGYLLQSIMYYLVGVDFIQLQMDAGVELLFGLVATILYIVMFGMLGYFIGTLVQMNKLFSVILPIIFVGDVMLASLNGRSSVIIQFFEMLFTEASFPLFLIKISIIIIFCFVMTIISSNRLEVK